MSELAFDLEGEPFAFSPRTQRLRVRRFRNPGQRGAPEVVHGGDGGQLYVSPSCSYLEFRKLVGNLPGRYRLDQCDDTGAAVDDEPPAYVTIMETPRNAAWSEGVDPRDTIIRDLAQTNAEIAKTIAERFASVMGAAAEILRAADGAGLPRREPPPVPPRDENGDGDEPEDDDDIDDDSDDDIKEKAFEKVWTMVEPMLPALGIWIATQLNKKFSPPSPAAVPALPPGSAPAADGAAVGVSPSQQAADAQAPSALPPTSSAPPPRAPAADTASAAPSASSSNSETTTATAPPSTAARTATPDGDAAIRNAAPIPTAEQIGHLLAIRSRLTPREMAIVDATLGQMTEEVKAHWLARLSMMTVNEAVTEVRAQIPPPRPRRAPREE